MVNIVLLFVTVSIFVVGINCSLESILSNYYKSEALKSFKTEWNKHKIAYENALVVALRESYGDTALNVFVKHGSSRRTTISKGFIFSDNVVKVLLFDMVLRDMPNLFMPDVSLELPSNTLKLEGTLSKIFIDTNYYMARSDSAIFYGSEKDLGKRHSPFSLQQVQTYGKLVIIAEDCFLNGFAIVTLAAESVNVGHSTFHLNDCKFTAEISPSDFSLPPVIAPYFANRTGRKIERLISAALLSELMPKLQGAVYSYINTTAILGDDLSKYRLNQQKIFKKTSDYLSDLCIKLNHLTLQENKGSVKLKDFEVHLKTKTDEVKHSHLVALKGMKLYGLDTAYAARTGGSFDTPHLSLADAIRFSSMQIRGKVPFENGTRSGMHDFAVELIDVTVNINIHVKPGSKPDTQCEVVGWRTLDFSIVPWETPLRERFGYESLVTGYIINEVPPRIIEHLSKVLTPLVDDEPYQENLKVIGQTDIENENDGNKTDDQNNEAGDKDDEKNVQANDADDQDNDADDQDNEADDQDDDKNDQANDADDQDNDADDQVNEADDKDDKKNDQANDADDQNNDADDRDDNKNYQDDDKDDQNKDEDIQNNEKMNFDSITNDQDYKKISNHEKSELSFESFSEDFNVDDLFKDDGGEKTIILDDGTKTVAFPDQIQIGGGYDDTDKMPEMPKEDEEYDDDVDHNTQKPPKDIEADETNEDYDVDNVKAKDEVNDDYDVDNGKPQDPSKDYKADEADDDYGIDNGNAQEEKGVVIVASGTEEEIARRTGKRNQSSMAHKTNLTYDKNRRRRIQQRLNKTTSNRNNNNPSDVPKLTFRKNMRVNIKKVSTRKESIDKKNVQVQVVHNTTRLPSVPHMSDNEIQ